MSQNLKLQVKAMKATDRKIRKALGIPDKLSTLNWIEMIHNDHADALAVYRYEARKARWFKLRLQRVQLAIRVASKMGWLTIPKGNIHGEVINEVVSGDFDRSDDGEFK